METAAAQNSIKTERNAGIDILRIVSMLLVVLLHTLGRGGILDAAAPGTAQYWCAWAIECAAFCAVNCYALISGYVGWKSEFRISRLIKLWLQVFFWSTVSSIVQFALHPDTFGFLPLVQSLFPVLSERYWYFTAYFVMYLFVPFMNHAINTLSRQKLWGSVLTITAAISLISIFTPWKDTLSMNDGYHFLWLCVLYMLGGCLARYPVVLFKRNWARLAAFFLCAAALLASKLALGALTMRAYGQIMHDDAFISYLSPLVIAEAVLLLNFFARLGVKRESTLVRELSGASFGVYLIHTGAFFWTYLLRGAFEGYAQLSAPLMCAEAILTAIGIYGLCAALDFLRKKLFELIKLPRAAEYSGEKLERLCQKLLNKLDSKGI